MKTKFLIIIGIILIFGVIVVTDISQNKLEWDKAVQEDWTPVNKEPLNINVSRQPEHVILDDSFERILESCSGKYGIPLEKKTLWLNDTHKITNYSCEIEKRNNSGVSIDRTVYPTPRPVPLDIASIEDGHIRLNPVDTCAGISIDRLSLDELNQRYPSTYTTKSGKTYEIKFLSINDDDLKKMPVLSELIRATHHIPFPLNGGISASKGLVENPDWNNYRDWYDQKKTEQFNLDEVLVRGFVYDEEYYSIGFSIC